MSGRSLYFAKSLKKKYFIKIDEMLALKGQEYVLTLSNRSGTPSPYRIRKPIIVKRRSRIKSFYNCQKKLLKMQNDTKSDFWKHAETVSMILEIFFFKLYFFGFLILV